MLGRGRFPFFYALVVVPPAARCSARRPIRASSPAVITLWLNPASAVLPRYYRYAANAIHCSNPTILTVIRSCHLLLLMTLYFLLLQTRCHFLSIPALHSMSMNQRVLWLPRHTYLTMQRLVLMLAATHGSRSSRLAGGMTANTNSRRICNMTVPTRADAQGSACRGYLGSRAASYASDASLGRCCGVGRAMIPGYAKFRGTLGQSGGETCGDPAA